MGKEILYHSEARKRIKDGVDKVANAVKTTLGPRGRNAIFRIGDKIVITSDGVTVARQISFKDEYENLGSQLVKEVATKTNDDAGDGTTTSTVLLQAILEKGLKHTEIGNDPMLLREGILRGVKMAIDEITQNAKEVKTKEEMKHVATISAQDEQIGEIIADAMDKVGKEGVITIEESGGYKIEADIVRGMKLNRGFVSPYMANPATNKAEIENPVILLTDKKFSSAKELLPILNTLASTGKRDIVIFAQEFIGDALAVLVLNKIKGILNVVAIQIPTVGEYGMETLEDMAYLTGGEVISETKGHKFQENNANELIQYLGTAEKVKVTKEDTVIIGGKGTKIEERAKSIQDQIDQEEDNFKSKKLQERLAKLIGGVGVIRVGGATQTEIKEKLYKIEDALNATKAAVEQGIIPGGGVALIKAKFAIENYLISDREVISEDEEKGLKILAEALESPLRQILFNAGVSDIALILELIRKSKNGEGFNFKGITAESVPTSMIDAIKEGIVDPAKVTISALVNAASVASSILTSETVIVDEVEDKSDKYNHNQ